MNRMTAYQITVNYCKELQILLEDIKITILTKGITVNKETLERTLKIGTASKQSCYFSWLCQSQ